MIRQIALICTLTAATACSNDFNGDGTEPSGNPDDMSPVQVDQDGDGLSEAQGDCDDSDAAVHPQADEVPYDGVDNDCSSKTLDDDLDQDGYGIDDDCDDEDKNINPGEDESVYNGIDDDCNDYTRDDDLDEDGYNADEDCDDDDDAIYPGSEELTDNGIDDDCDDLIDERFTTEFVDESCDCGASSSITVDRHGTAHVVYADATEGTILYKYRTQAGVWSTAVVVAEPDGWAGEHLDLTVDSFDQLHMAFTILSSDESSRGLYYMFADNHGSWSEIYAVDTGVNLPSSEDDTPATVDVGWYVDLKVDSYNAPIFAYMDNNRGVPVVAQFNQNGDTDTLDQDYVITGSTGHYVNLGLDSNNRVHTVFHNQGLYLDVRYTQWERLIFSEVVDTREGLYTSLAMKGDVPCVSFYDNADQDLIYSCREEGAWETRQVLKDGNMGAYSQLVMTDEDVPNILYYDGNSDSLRMMVKPGIGMWEQVDVDTSPGTGQHISASAGPEGRVYTTYYDQGTGSLKFSMGR